MRASEDRHELLISVLSAFGFERFWQEERHLRAYLPAARWDKIDRPLLEEKLRALGVEGPLTSRSVGTENWNARWEEGLVPVTAGPFLVKPTWVEAPRGHEARFVLEIDPKMSFGTGHHASTRLALRLLAETLPSEAEAAGLRVLDAGTGTAVLAIAALRLGAASVLAFDTDARVHENAAENVARNGVADRVELRTGTLVDVVPEGGFGLILANINRNVLSELLPAFGEKLTPGGHAILAGLFLSDRTPLLKRAAACGLRLEAEQSEEEWWAVRLGHETETA